MSQIKHQTTFKFIPTVLAIFALTCTMILPSNTWAQTNWSAVPGGALDIDAGGADGNRVWVIGTDGNMYPYNPHPTRVSNPWDPFAPPAQGCKRVAVDDEGNAWVVDGQNNIWRFDGVGKFQKIPGAALDIGASTGRVWAIGTDGNIYPYNNHPTRVSNPWDPFAPPTQGCTAITVDGDDKGWVVGGNTTIHRFTPAQ